MANTTEKDVLELSLGVDVNSALKSVNKFRTAGSKAAQAISKGMTALGKNIAKMTSTNINKMSVGIQQATAAYKEYGSSVKKYNTIIASSQKKLNDANEDDKKLIQEKIDRYKELKKQALKTTKLGRVVGEAKKLGKHGKATGKSLAEAGRSFWSKDMKGGIEHAAKSLGNAMSSGKVTGKWAKKAGDSFWGKAREKWTGAKGKMSSGNMLGAAGSAVGAGASGAMGGMMKGMEGLLKMLGAMGPLLTVTAGIFAGIVKLMLDAEAAAKEMNKKILEVSGTSAQFYKNAENGEVALEDISGTLRAIRDSANSLDNISWGISKEDHMAVINALSQEGVKLDTIKDQYKKTGDAAKDAAAQAAIFGDAVHVAVAYSREFGVSLQEISTFQGEMMTELGSSLDDVKKTFHEMTKGAAESGIASNKFFAIIRGVSSDLSLYNTRMEDAVHVLTMLGKVMSPRNAQKFLSYSMNAVKGMGRVERIQTTLLAGTGKTGGVVDRDIERGKSGLAEKMASASGGKGTADKYRAAIEKGGSAFTDALKDLPEQMRGEMREAQLEIGIKQQKRKGGGLVGTAMAAGGVSAGGQLQIITDMLKKFTGGKGINASLGTTELQMFAESRGISDDQLDQLAKTETTMEDQRDLLKKNLHDGKTQMKLDKAGIKLTGNDAKDSQAIDQAGYDQIMDTLDDDAKSSLKGAETEMDYAKQTSKFTSTAADKLAQILDWLMNKLWDLMNDMYDLISGIASSKIFGGDGGAHSKLVKLQLAAAKSGSPELQAMLGAAKNLDQARAAIFKAGKGQEEGLYKGGDEGAANRSTFEKSLTANVSTDDLSSAVEKGLKDTNVGKNQGLNILRDLQKGFGLGEAMKRQNLGDTDQGAVLDKLRQYLPNEDLVKVTSGSSGSAATPDTTAPVPPTAPVSPAHVAAAVAAKAPDPVTSDQGEAISGGIADLQNTVTTKGMKLDKPFLKNTFWKEGHDQILDANRIALFEYFLYSKMDPATVAAGLKSGDFSASTFGQGVADQATTSGIISQPMKGMANGGVVPTPKSPDQVFVAARPGETITPKGGGGGGSINIPINVNGPGAAELGKMMQDAAKNVVVEWQRKHKYT